MGCLKLEHSNFSSPLKVVHNNLKFSENSCAGAYRYGFNSQEKEDEIAQGVYTAEYWKYDSRIGRRWNLDPKPNASISSYATFANNPLWYTDHLGDTVTITGSDNHTLTIIVPGDNYEFDLDMEFGEDLEFDPGIDKLKDLAIGFQVNAGVESGAGAGVEAAGNLTKMLFFDEDYGGYWYTFGGGDMGLKVGTPTVGVGVEARLIIGSRKEGGRYGPEAFHGDYTYTGGSLQVDAFAKAGFSYTYAEGTDWETHEIGVNIGADLIPNVVEAKVSHGKGKLKVLNDVKKTSERSWWDIIGNWVTVGVAL